MEVKTKSGMVRGRKDVSILTEKPYFSFLGIPYAEPPVGDLRFKPPIPIKKWNGTLDATKEGNMCPQKDRTVTDHEVVIGNEDCLYLNVYAKHAPSEGCGLKPVMVYVYGGTFRFGTPAWINKAPDFLIDHDIILVIMNYRQGALGFLNLNIPECPGNVGIKDQVLAFRWVKDNIRDFGGDPDNVTAFGNSSGAFFVHILAISPLSRGLFHRCILQSGTIFTVYPMSEDNVEAAFKLGRLLGYTGTDKKELLAVLKSADLKDLIFGTQTLEEQCTEEHPYRLFTIQFLPTIERIRDGSVIPCKPEVLLRQAKRMPMILGVTKIEGLPTHQYVSPYSREELDCFVKENLRVEDPIKVAKLSKLLQEFYFDSEPASSKNISGFVDLLGDCIFLGDFYRSFHVTSKTPSVYNYLFEYEGSFNKAKRAAYSFYPDTMKGACHSDELGYLFFARNVYPDLSQFKEADVKIIHTLCKFWTNFAKTGDPNDDSTCPKWLPVALHQPCYIEISDDLSMKMGYIEEKRIRFWEYIRKIVDS